MMNWLSSFLSNPWAAYSMMPFLSPAFGAGGAFPMGPHMPTWTNPQTGATYRWSGSGWTDLNGIPPPAGTVPQSVPTAPFYGVPPLPVDTSLPTQLNAATGLPVGQAPAQAAGGTPAPAAPAPQLAPGFTAAPSGLSYPYLYSAPGSGNVPAPASQFEYNYLTSGREPGGLK